MNGTKYIYEEAESMYLQDPDNSFYYYKRQTPKQTIEITKRPHKDAIVDIYNDPKYYNVDTDSEIDMDDLDEYPYNDNDATDANDLLTKLRSHLSTISTTSSILPPPLIVVPSVEKPKQSVKITKKNRKGKGKSRYTKHAYKAPAKNSY
jgi:hypothetical protein